MDRSSQKKTTDDPYHVESSSVNYLDTSATTEMTGLIPRQIVSDGEADAYKGLYPFSPEQYVQKDSVSKQKKQSH